jgi:hypothetical protein
VKRGHPKPAPIAKAALVAQPKGPSRSEVLGPSLVPLAANQTISVPSALQFFLAFMIGASVLVAAFAVVPRRAFPRPLPGGLGQRELLLVAIGLDAAAVFVLLVYVLAVS